MDKLFIGEKNSAYWPYININYSKEDNNLIINYGKIYTKAKDDGINNPKKSKIQINLQQKSKIKENLYSKTILSVYGGEINIIYGHGLDANGDIELLGRVISLTNIPIKNINSNICFFIGDYFIG